MSAGRARDAERSTALVTVLRDLSAATVGALASSAPPERERILAPIVTTDRAMLHALGEGPGQPDAFEPGRWALVDALRGRPLRTRLPWHGGPMTVRWALQNRVAATWALLDRLAEQRGAARPEPVRAIVELALELLPHSFLRAGRAAPDTTVVVELSAPDGSSWHLSGPQPADWPPPVDVVNGPAIDCCRLACGRTSRVATTLRADGDVAEAWLDVIDALAYGEPP